MSDTVGGGEAVESLVRRAQDGDDDAFERLVGRFYPHIYRWALVRTGDPDDAEDVVQIVLVRLYRKLGSFDGRSSFSTWLYRVVGNASQGFLRGRLRRGRLAQRLAQAGGHGGAVTAGAEAAVTSRETMTLVKAFLVELPDRQREVFDLVDLQGFEPVEVSRMMELEPVTVRTHLFRARRVIRKRILESHPELVEGYRS